MANMNKQIVSYLVEKGMIQRGDVESAFPSGQFPEDFTFEEYLIKPGLLTPQKFRSALEGFFGAPFASEDDFPKEPMLFDQLSMQFMKEAKFIPAYLENNTLTVIMSNPLDFYILDAIRVATSHEIKVLVGQESEILQAIERSYGSGPSSMEKIIEDMDRIPEYREDDEENVDHLRDMASEGPVIRLVNLIISRAIERRASDIHFEPFEDHFRVRYRIDGVLHDVESPPKRLQAAIISRVKIMAKLNIAERRLPQDGRIMLRVKGKEIDFRVSSVPTIHGESTVLRILDKSSIVLDIEALGFSGDILEEFKGLIENPHGIILVTGPTGSGKTTTLYSALSELNKETENIITAEDPIEYNFMGINQVQMHEEIGLTFASSLRSFLRQDPDIIMVGEIRDFETAQIAVQAALTGHLVLSTVHTNDAPGTISRLIDMGIEPFLISSAIVLILAQRLIRKTCMECREPVKVHPQLLIDLGIPPDEVKSFPVYKGKGCSLCNNTGYKGRVGLYEVMPMKEEVKELVLSRASTSEVKKEAMRLGMKTLRQSGIAKIKEGVTTIEEVLRSTIEDR
jgi:type IV-A pilus assembly ATPase PilB